MEQIPHQLIDVDSLSIPLEFTLEGLDPPKL